MNNSILNQPQRQSAVGTLFEFIRSFRVIFRVLWPLLLVYIFKGDFTKIFQGYWWLIALFLLIIFIVNAILSWYNSFFYIKNNELVLKRGYLKKWVTTIPFDKIVSVNIKQGVIHQLFDIVQLEVDSAGSKDKEIQIKALSKEMAELLQKELTVQVEEQSEKEVSEQPDNEIVLQHNISNLLRIGISENHLKGLLILLAFGNNIYQELKGIFNEELSDVSTRATNYFDSSALYFQLFFVVFLLLLGVLISVVNIILRYYDLKVIKQAKLFTIKQGLLTQKQITIPFVKVQVIRRSQNPIQKWLGISTVQIIQATSSIVDKRKEKVFIHGCDNNQYLQFCNTIFQNPLDKSYEIVRPHRRFMLRNFNLLLLIMLPVALFFSLVVDLYWVAFALLPLTILITWLNYKKRSYAIGSQYLIVNAGIFAKTQAITAIEKIQTIKIKQTFFQQRNGTATLTVYVPGDILKISYIDKEEAIFIKDNLLIHSA